VRIDSLLERINSRHKTSRPAGEPAVAAIR
jgi:hypothetical protein